MLWEGKSYNKFFLKEDIMECIMAFLFLAAQIYIWSNDIENGKLSDAFTSVFLLGMFFYKAFVRIIIRFFYIKNVYYKLYQDRLVIELKIFKRLYLREFYLKDISAFRIKKYSEDFGNIHFGDAELKYWNREKYTDFHYSEKVTITGLLRKNNKYHTGIIFNIQNPEKVCALLKDKVHWIK